MNSYRTIHALSILAAITWANNVVGQNTTAYPSKPVRVVVAQGTGGATDIQARLFSGKVSENVGQQFIVDNRSGGGAASVVAQTIVAKASPDGYTIMAVTPSFTFSPALYKDFPYDPIKNFAAVSLLTRAPYVLVVSPTVPAKSVKELIALEAAQPGKLNFGAGNIGTGTHLITMWFLSAAKIKATYVPYKSVGMAEVDLLAGRIQGTFANVLTAVPIVKSGKLRALGISTLERSKVMPDLPTIAEQGVTGYNASTFHGYVAPSGTPAPVLNKLSAEFSKVVKTPAIADKITADGAEPIGSTPAQFQKMITDEVLLWRKLIKDAGLKVE